jgi:hypothetical protein
MMEAEKSHAEIAHNESNHSSDAVDEKGLASKNDDLPFEPSDEDVVTFKTWIVVTVSV